MSERKKYTATSPSGDLQEALRGAIAAAHRDLNANYFAWQLEGVSGSVGGFVGARNVSVTVSANTPGAKMAARQQESGECADWETWHDRMPGKRPTLHVVGVCTFPTSGYGVELRPRVAQGTNPAIYMLDRIVLEPIGPVLDVITPVPVHYREQTSARYTQVQIFPEGVLIDVQEVS